MSNGPLANLSDEDKESFRKFVDDFSSAHSDIKNRFINACTQSFEITGIVNAYYRWADEESIWECMGISDATDSNKHNFDECGLIATGGETLGIIEVGVEDISKLLSFVKDGKLEYVSEKGYLRGDGKYNSCKITGNISISLTGE